MRDWHIRIKSHGDLASIVLERAGSKQFIGQLRVARSGWSRFLGWRAKGHLLGVWLTPCRSIHTFGMDTAIDLVWLNKHKHIVHIEANVQPSLWCYRADAHSVIELPGGILEKYELFGAAANVA